LLPAEELALSLPKGGRQPLVSIRSVRMAQSQECTLLVKVRYHVVSCSNHPTTVELLGERNQI